MHCDVSADVLEIQAVMAEYVHRIDDGDLVGFAEMFRGGVWGMRGLELSGGPELHRWMQEHIILYDGVPRTRHLNTAVRVRVDGDTAMAVSDLTLFQQVPPDFPLQVIVCARYDDAFVRTDEGWRFARRIAATRLLGDTTRHIR